MAHQQINFSTLITDSLPPVPVLNGYKHAGSWTTKQN